jgi:chromosome segregation ATPase
VRVPHGLAALPVVALLLVGCGADPAADRRSQVAAVIEAANSGDADRLRDEADRLVETVTAHQERQDVAADEATRLIALAEAVRTNADAIDEELLEQRRREAEAEAAAEAERKRLEEERQRLEAERKQLEEERRKAEEEEDSKRGEDEDKKKGEGKDDD